MWLNSNTQGFFFQLFRLNINGVFFCLFSYRTLTSALKITRTLLWWVWSCLSLQTDIRRQVEVNNYHPRVSSLETENIDSPLVFVRLSLPLCIVVHFRSRCWCPCGIVSAREFTAVIGCDVCLAHLWAVTTRLTGQIFTAGSHTG